MAYGIVRQIFTLAERLEPNRQAIWEWMCQTPINALGEQTALELVLAGQGEQVVTLLEVALEDEAVESHRKACAVGDRPISQRDTAAQD